MGTRKPGHCSGLAHQVGKHAAFKNRKTNKARPISILAYHLDTWVVQAVVPRGRVQAEPDNGELRRDGELEFKQQCSE